MTHPQRAVHLQAILKFLTRVGIEVTFEELPGSTFLPGLAIRDGTLVVDRDALEWPGDLLHEAGHLAVLPPSVREQAGDALEFGDPIANAGEVEAIAWAYAASVDLDLPIDVLFHPGGYKGQSEGLIQTYSLGVFPGLAGLCATGMAVAPRAGVPGEPVYPRMARWLRE